MRTIKKIAFLDRFYKKCCCGAINHPSSWAKEKHLNQYETPNYCPFCGVRVVESEVSNVDKDNCNTCIHHKPDNPYCECCIDMDKYEKEE